MPNQRSPSSQAERDGELRAILQHLLALNDVATVLDGLSDLLIDGQERLAIVLATLASAVRDARAAAAVRSAEECCG